MSEITIEAPHGWIVRPHVGVNALHCLEHEAAPVWVTVCELRRGGWLVVVREAHTVCTCVRVPWEHGADALQAAFTAACLGVERGEYLQPWHRGAY